MNFWLVMISQIFGGIISMDKKKIKEWLDDILMVEYKEERKSELKLEDIKEMFEDGKSF